MDEKLNVVIKNYEDSEKGNVSAYFIIGDQYFSINIYKPSAGFVLDTPGICYEVQIGKIIIKEEIDISSESFINIENFVVGIKGKLYNAIPKFVFMHRVEVEDKNISITLDDIKSEIAKFVRIEFNAIAVFE